ncbi:hypothetical protein Fcan01_12689 [Folsomia candida]|uniref:Uncharacterized protein n=1 Tax=Folsomia candida TaxID=158441 RepID=A0A226E6N4_FOLCA|nr:hypothetical protein Fcan01_12689 [Folsomia candida]
MIAYRDCRADIAFPTLIQYHRQRERLGLVVVSNFTNSTTNHHRQPVLPGQLVRDMHDVATGWTKLSEKRGDIRQQEYYSDDDDNDDDDSAATLVQKFSPFGPQSPFYGSTYFFIMPIVAPTCSICIHSSPLSHTHYHQPNHHDCQLTLAGPVPPLSPLHIHQLTTLSVPQVSHNFANYVRLKNGIGHKRKQVSGKLRFKRKQWVKLEYLFISGLNLLTQSEKG